MLRETRSPLRILLPLCVILAACASEGTDPAGSEGDETSEADVTAQAACPAEKYNDARAVYKKAVASAKVRKAGNACTGAATLYNIANQAGEAVKKCPSFAQVIKTSAYAADLRGELRGSLAYAVLTGSLKEDWTGLEAALASGVTLYGTDQTSVVSGNRTKITFGASGKASFLTRGQDAAGNQSWRSAPLTYKVGRKLGSNGIDTSVELPMSGANIDAARGTPKLVRDLILNWGPTFSLKLGEDDYIAYPTECTR